MSINHYYKDLPERQWWPQYQQQQQSINMEPKPFISQPNHPWSNPQISNHHQAWLNSPHSTPHFHNNSLSLNLNQSNEDVQQFQDEAAVTTMTSEDRESQIMFEKPLTPSDVGKLNRLVIPKQHAEKYFPLNSGGGDSGGGMLLSFEDEMGKLWRFRYSYWNSSQSYVLTKGWSRYVKEKRLDAGDVVLFERHLTDPDRLFIGWRRRADPAHDTPVAHGGGDSNINSINNHNNNNSQSGDEWTRVFYSAHPYPSQPLPYQPDCLHAGTSGLNQTTPVGNSRRLRLFGVNLECQVDDDDLSEPPTPDGSSLSSQGLAHHYQFYPEFHAASRHNHMMDITISRDANHMRNRRG